MDRQIETTTAYIELPMDRIREGVHCFNVDKTLVEKKEDHIVLSREDFEKAILDAFQSGINHQMFTAYPYATVKHPNKEKYLAALLKPKING